MLISIIGTHGIPARYGGFETFAEHLAAACLREKMDVRVINDKDNPADDYKGNAEIVFSKYSKSKSPLRFYKDSLKLSAGSEIILSCGVGGSFFYDNNANHRSAIITNVDGLEHLRGKYSLLQRSVIYFLQKAAIRKSDIIVCDSAEVENYWKGRFPDHNTKMNMIAYGADECEKFIPEVLSDNGLVKNEYYLLIARLVPENNIHKIIDAFSGYLGSKKLVITGPVNDSAYVNRLLHTSDSRIHFTDAIYDKKILDSLRQGCFAYIHGHSVGGTNPSLLEAMSAGCVCICHNNVFNKEVTAGTQMYFNSNDDLAIMLNLLEHKTGLETLKQKSLAQISSEYSWEKVTSSYIDLFHSLTNTRSGNAHSENAVVNE